ncbi:MAG: hypothetical protein K2H36_01515 [Clostridia bacterium]|nr:hypothetical protein [Clostridia bacterium]
MENQEYKDALAKDDKEEQLLIRSAKWEAQNFSKVGFLLALIPFAIRMFVTFIYSTLLSIGGDKIRWLYKVSSYYNVFLRITCCIGVAGLVISALGYKKSAKDDVVSKKFSAVGIAFGSLQAWLLLSAFISLIIGKIANAL